MLFISGWTTKTKSSFLRILRIQNYLHKHAQNTHTRCLANWGAKPITTHRCKWDQSDLSILKCWLIRLECKRYKYTNSQITKDKLWKPHKRCIGWLGERGGDLHFLNLAYSIRMFDMRLFHIQHESLPSLRSITINSGSKSSHARELATNSQKCCPFHGITLNKKFWTDNRALVLTLTFFFLFFSFFKMLAAYEGVCQHIRS